MRLLSLLVVVLVLAPVGVAHADHEDTPAAVTSREAAVWVIEELVVLAELGALTDDPHVEQVLEWAGVTGAPRVTLRQWLEEVDGFNAFDLESAENAGWSPPGESSRVALEPLPAAWLAAIDAGEGGVVDARLYLDGALELMLAAGLPAPRDGAPAGRLVLEVLEALPEQGQAGLEHLETVGFPELGAGSSPTAPAEQAPAEQVTDEQVTDEQDGVVAGDQSPVEDQPDEPTDEPTFGAGLAVAGGAGLLAVLAMAVLGLRRRRDDGSSTPGDVRSTPGEVPSVPGDVPSTPGDVPSTSDARVVPPPPPPGAATVPDVPRRSPAAVVLEAGRWMTEALDPSLIRAIAIDTAVELLGADDGCYVEGRRAAARWTPAPPAWAADAPQDDPVVARALDTAQAGTHVTTGPDDQQHAIAAAPVLVDGALVGALVVCRHGTAPFSRDDLAPLELLTPVVGTAFGAAHTHRGAVAAAEVDELTQLRNRRRLDADLGLLIDREMTSFAMVDVDHFKHFNDTNGHAAGDEALRAVAAAIATAVRPSDDAYRYGGEEFAVLLHGCDAEGAVLVMERVRAAVAELDVPGTEHQPAGHLSVSIGVASVRGVGSRRLVELADAALYRAKDAGRNRVVLADADLTLPR